MHTVYMIKNLITGKAYIGVTSGLYTLRWQQHNWNAKNNVKGHLYNAIRKYDTNTWIIGVIEDGIPSYLRSIKEITYIKMYNTFKEGYNLTLGGEGRLGYIMPEDIKRKIGVANKGNVPTIQQVQSFMKIAHLGRVSRKHTDKSKALISLNSRSYKGMPGHLHTAATKNILAEKSKENNSRASVTSWSITYECGRVEIFNGVSKKKYAEERGWNPKSFKSRFNSPTVTKTGDFKGLLCQTL